MDIAVNSEVNNKKDDGTAIDMSRKIALHNYPYNEFHFKINLRLFF